MVPKIRVKKQQLKSELESVVRGKTTLKTFFKSGTEIQQLQANLTKQIEELEDDEKSCHQLELYLDSYLIGQSQRFKQEKIEDFAHIVREMATINVDNSNHSSGYFSKLLSDPKLTHANKE